MSSHSLEGFLISLCCSAILAFSQCSSRFCISPLFPTLQKVFLAQLFKAECLSNHQLPAIGSMNTKGEASKIGIKRETSHLSSRNPSISLRIQLKYLSSGSVQKTGACFDTLLKIRFLPSYLTMYLGSNTQWNVWNSNYPAGNYSS